MVLSFDEYGVAKEGLQEAEQKQKGHAIETMSMAALRRHNPLLYRELVEALAVSSVDRLASLIPVGDE